ncbi:MAG: type sorting protein [Ferruginibacter sp.]|uniref:T9SS type A sorting domain-containing protein n=1 Tax=Ferruginibacter sp. TaxID=1940288 RepID=UPI002657B013|nr:T9SS type A sorting domain-containing protein [Ferruginibacter sp.]MDB5277897.1 type sorting protein [Ferruginibacter sp.]
MKPLYFISLCLATFSASCQITTPTIKASFGVDADLKANYFNNFGQSGNDDWFNINSGSGQYVIDTTGAAAIVQGYSTNPATRNLPFYRTMHFPAYTIVNNRLLIDAVYTRDYHGQDSTMFASGSNKNGDSPASWSCPVSQSIPDKNEILDMMVHVRRAGPDVTDSLWMFGGVSIENTSGSRYVDFEMYQTDIYYDRGPRQFFGYGPDAGHTSWKFNNAGDIISAGDVIFSAQYNTGLDSLEARIWVDRAALSMVPMDFAWTGSFDGAASGSQFGYAGIRPLTPGAFYTGLTCSANTWAGPFQLVLGDNSLHTDYTTTQFMEFSVNLSKIGLDPVNLLGAPSCGMPFRRVLVKSRASNSFTAALKDFVGPFDFFMAAKANIFADIPMFCGALGVSNLTVTNPVANSVYTWSTLDGHFSGDTTGTSVFADAPGTYFVTQRLQTGCPAYARDTLSITYSTNCTVLETNIISFSVTKEKQLAQLNWSVANNAQINYFQVEQSWDGIHFQLAGNPQKATAAEAAAAYNSTSKIPLSTAPSIYYRLKIVGKDGKGSYSKIVQVQADEIVSSMEIAPNPAKNKVHITLFSSKEETVQLLLFDFTGKLLQSTERQIKSGTSVLHLNELEKFEPGVYAVKATIGKKVFVKQFVLTR